MGNYVFDVFCMNISVILYALNRSVATDRRSLNSTIIDLLYNSLVFFSWHVHDRVFCLWHCPACWQLGGVNLWGGWVRATGQYKYLLYCCGDKFSWSIEHRLFRLLVGMKSGFTPCKSTFISTSTHKFQQNASLKKCPMWNCPSWDILILAQNVQFGLHIFAYAVLPIKIPKEPIQVVFNTS